jgi:C4-dicarboxylate transporter DctQ subunit
MNQLNKILLISEKIIGTFLLIMMFLIISVNIIFRYFLDNPIFWAEELSNYLFVWMALLSCAYNVGKNGHIRVNIFIQIFDKKLRDIIFILMDVLLLVLFIYLIIPNWKVIGTLSVSAAMRMPEKYIYAIIPILFVLSAFHILINIFSNIHRMYTDN